MKRKRAIKLLMAANPFSRPKNAAWWMDQAHRDFPKLSNLQAVVLALAIGGMAMREQEKKLRELGMPEQAEVARRVRLSVDKIRYQMQKRYGAELFEFPEDWDPKHLITDKDE